MKNSKRNNKKNKKKKVWLYPLVLVAVFAISTGVSYFHFKDEFMFESSFIADIESRLAKSLEKEVYESGEVDPSITNGMVFRKDTLLVIAEDIIRNHVEPYDVRLMDLYVDKGGVVYIDFGSEIKKNFKGDALEELKIIYGLFNGMKSTFPGFTALKILIEGREDESFGGHIDISKPIGEEIAESI
jgi:hypothetical protein